MAKVDMKFSTQEVRVIWNRVQFNKDTTEQDWKYRQCAIAAGLSYQVTPGKLGSVYYCDLGNAGRWQDFNNRIERLVAEENANEDN